MTVKQGTLPIKAGDKYTQKDITGKSTLKTSTPKDLQEKADTYFLRKADLACAKSNVDKAADALMVGMAKHEVTQVKVKDDMGNVKRIIIKVGDEKLKVEAAND
jgi:hypothetical protein